MACELNIYQNTEIFINDFEKRLKTLENASKRFKTLQNASKRLKSKISTIQGDLSEIKPTYKRNRKNKYLYSGNYSTHHNLQVSLISGVFFAPNSKVGGKLRINHWM
jgi:hypothetical protein